MSKFLKKNKYSTRHLQLNSLDFVVLCRTHTVINVHLNVHLHSIFECK